MSPTDIESKLQEMLNEIQKIEAETERTNLLEKKKAWAAFDAQEKYVASLNESYDLLKEQGLELEQQTKSLEDKMSPKRQLKQVQ